MKPFTRAVERLPVVSHANRVIPSAVIVQAEIVEEMIARLAAAKKQRLNPKLIRSMTTNLHSTKQHLAALQRKKGDSF